MIIVILLGVAVFLGLPAAMCFQENVHGWGFTFLFFGLLLCFIAGSKVTQPALDSCEKNLPRNEHCVIIAVPATTQDKSGEK